MPAPSNEAERLKLALLEARAEAAVLRNFVKEKRQDACVCTREQQQAGERCVNCAYYDRILSREAGKSLLDHLLAQRIELARLRAENAALRGEPRA